MLHPSLIDRAGELRARWRERPCLRIEPFLAADVAGEVDAAVAAGAWTLHAERGRFNYQYWRAEVEPDDDCRHPLCELARWLWTDGAAWLGAVTDLDLAAPPHRTLTATRFDRGCYLDAHSDCDGHRAVAYVLGLTRDVPAAGEGGHLEFVAADGDVVRVVDRRPPSWNSLDLFDVTDHRFVHRVPMVTRRCDRRAVSGWLFRSR